jgi:hypothetical protein
VSDPRVAFACALLPLAGCEAQRVEYRPLPAYLEAAGIVPEPTVLDDGTLLVYQPRKGVEKAAHDADAASEAADGPARSLLPEQVLSQVMRCLIDEDWERLYNDVLSSRTRDAYESNEMGFEEFRTFFATNRDDLYSALNRISIGLRSPEVVIGRAPGGGIRIQMHRLYTKGFKFTTVDLIYEDYGLKLLMIR